MALDAFGLGEGSPGFLSALVGGGALTSILVTRVAVRRSRLRWALTSSLAATAAIAVALGLQLSAPAAYVTLPILGVCMASMDTLSRMLLQRSSDPRALGSLVATLGLVAGLSQLAGSILAQVAVAIRGVEAGLVVIGAALVALVIASIRWLRDADVHADVPVLEMALLSELPTLAVLPRAPLEQVARLADTVAVQAGDTLVSEGTPGDSCLVVAEGEFDASVRGTHRRVLRRGDVVGEAALLANLPRSSTITAITNGSVLRIEREPFLVALTGQPIASPDDPIDHVDARAWYRSSVAAHARRSRPTTRTAPAHGSASAPLVECSAIAAFPMLSSGPPAWRRRAAMTPRWARPRRWRHGRERSSSWPTIPTTR